MTAGIGMHARYALPVRPDSPEVAELLRSHGLRATRARRLLMALMVHRNDHLSAEELRRELARRGYVLSTATLYQNLKRLARAGLIASFAGSDGVTRYDANTDSHAHLVCTRCGRVLDIEPDNPLLAGADAGLPSGGRSYRGWRVAGARLELLGMCPQCRKRP